MHTIVICKTFYVCEELLVSNAFAILAPAVGAKTFFFVFDKNDNILCKRPRSIFRLYENNKGWHPLKFVATPLIMHHEIKIWFMNIMIYQI